MNRGGAGRGERPRVTLSYAQSLDGSIAARAGAPLALSGPEAKRMTHQLRAAHDAILVGIGTVQADDPQLDVRLVPGPNPRPIILDGHLRCPPTARCIDAKRGTLIVAAAHAAADRQRALEAAGARVVRLPANGSAETYTDLDALLAELAAEGIGSLMVEGGARVITSFLQAHLVDRVVLTVAPVLVGGVRGVNARLGEAPHLPRLREVTVEPCGEDWVVAGAVEW